MVSNATPPNNATLALILQLHSEDIQELLASEKVIDLTDGASDQFIALTTYQQELRLHRDVLSDRAMAQSLGNAVVTDAELLRRHQQQEEATTSDRRMACRIGGYGIVAASGTAANPLRIDDPIFVDRLARVFNGVTDDRSAGTREDGQTENARTHVPIITRLCVACSSNKPAYQTLNAPCGHIYCEPCINTLFDLASTDESAFPPRCCRQSIPLDSVKTYLKPKTRAKFDLKAIEFNTPNRTYCHKPLCSAFIPPSSITSELAVCPECASITCVNCKADFHPGDCPVDEGTRAVLETAQQAGWQRCNKCRAVVELNVGCNHITYVSPRFSCGLALH